MKQPANPEKRHAPWQRSREAIRRAYRDYPDVQSLFRDLDEAIEALREIARPALGGKMQQYRAQSALAKIDLLGRTLR